MISTRNAVVAGIGRKAAAHRTTGKPVVEGIVVGAGAEGAEVAEVQVIRPW